MLLPDLSAEIVHLFGELFEEVNGIGLWRGSNSAGVEVALVTDVRLALIKLPFGLLQLGVEILKLHIQPRHRIVGRFDTAVWSPDSAVLKNPTTIVADVHEQPGGLPLLQYTLTELFERRDGRILTSAAYQEIGGVLGALGRRAEEVYQGLDQDGQAAARQLFLRLVTLGEGTEDTRRRALRSELNEGALVNG